MSRIKKFLLALVLILAGTCGLVLAGCTKNNYSKVDFVLSDTQVSLTKVGYSAGESKTITAEIKGTNGNINKKITFVSSSAEVATVEEVSFSGSTTIVKITAQGGGVATVYAIAEGNVKKVINVSVTQEASEIRFNTSYNPLIIRGEEFVLDGNNVLIFPSSTSDKSFSAQLITPNETINFSRDASGRVYLPEDITSNLVIGQEYSVRISKGTSRGVLTDEKQASVKEIINAGNFSIVDIKGNETNLNLSTNVVDYREGEADNRSSLQFKIKYTVVNVDGEIENVYYNPADFVFTFSESENYEISYHEAGSESYFEIQAKHKTKGEKIILKIAYAGFEGQYDAEKTLTTTITTYPSSMQIVSGSERITISEETPFNIYTNAETTFTIANVPVETDANDLLLEILAKDFGKFETFKINGESVTTYQVQIPVSVGDVITVQGKKSAINSELSMTVRNATYTDFEMTQTIAIRKAVEIDKYYSFDGTIYTELTDDLSVVGAAGTVKNIYFTISEEDAYLDGFSFVSGNTDYVRVLSSVEEVGTYGGKTLYRLGLSCLADTQDGKISVTPKNGSILDTSKILNVKVVTAVSFEDQDEENPRIYFLGSDLESKINISSVTRNPNNGNVEKIVLNNSFIDNTLPKGEVKLNLSCAPVGATIPSKRITIKYNGTTVYPVEDSTTDAGYITAVLKDNILTINVKENGWDKKYTIEVSLTYYNSSAEEKTLTRTIELEAYKKINYSDITFSEDSVSLISRDTAGESIEKASKHLIFTVNNSSDLKIPTVSFNFANAVGDENITTLTGTNGRVWTYLSNSALSMIYSEREETAGVYDIYVFSNSATGTSRLNDFVIATVSQGSVTYTKYVQITVVNQSVSTSLLIDDSYKTDGEGNIVYTINKNELPGDGKISLENSLLPYGVSGIGFEVLSGSYLESINGALYATGAGVSGIVRIYAQDNKMFNISSLVWHFINNSDISFEDKETSKYQDVIIRVEDGSEEAPFSIFTNEDLLAIKNKTSESFLHYELKNNLSVPAQVGTVLDDISNLSISGNGYRIELQNPLATSLTNVTLSNIKFVLGSNALVSGNVDSSTLVGGNVDSSTFSGLEVYSNASYIFGIVTNESHVTSSKFIRSNGSYAEFFGIAKAVSSNSTLDLNEVELRITNSTENTGFTSFAGIAGEVDSSHISNNWVYFYEGLGVTYQIKIASTGKGAIVALTAKNSYITSNKVLSYLSGKINNLGGEFAGVVHTSLGSNISYNSVYASLNGAAAAYNVYLSDGTTTYNYTTFANNNFVISNGANGKLVPTGELFVTDLRSESKELLYSASTTYEYFDGINWVPLTNVSGTHYTYTDENESTTYFVIDSENSKYYITDSTYTDETNVLTLVNTKNVLKTESSVLKLFNENEWVELSALTGNEKYNYTANGINYIIPAEVATSIFYYPNNVAGLIYNSVYFNAESTGFNENELAILSKNLFVYDPNGGGTSTLGSAVIKLNADGFKMQSNFTMFDAEAQKYYGLPFTFGAYESYVIQNGSVVANAYTSVLEQNWTMTSERPVLVVRSMDGNTPIDLARASTIDVTNKGNVEKSTGDNEAYLYLPDGFKIGSTLNLTDLFTISIDGAASDAFDFIISEGSSFEKTQDGRIKVNGYGYLKLTVYCKTNVSVSKDIVLFIYENNLGKIYNSKTGDEIKNNSTAMVREGETFSFYVVSDGIEISLSRTIYFVIDSENNNYYITDSTYEKQMTELDLVTDKDGASVNSIYYNTETEKYEYFDGITWIIVTDKDGKYYITTELTSVGNGVYVVSPTEDQTISKTVKLTGGNTEYTFNLDTGFKIKTYKGATDVNISFDANEFTKIDQVNAQIVIRTDKGAVSESEIESYLTIAKQNNNLPELKFRVLNIDTEEETVLGVTYYTTYINGQFYFGDFDALADNNQTGSYEISVKVDEKSDTKTLKLNTQKILTSDYTHYVVGSDPNATITTNAMYETDSNKPVAYITPGSNSILDLYVYPYYADFAYAEITSNTLTGSQGSASISFEQKVLNGSSFDNLTAEGIAGGIKLKKQSTPNSFNGHFYVKTLLLTDSAYYLTSGQNFILTVRFFDENGKQFGKALQLQIMVETIKSVEITMPEYIAAGVETEISIKETEDADVETTYNVFLVVDGEETQNYNYYVTGPYYRDGKYYVLADINLFYNTALKNAKVIELKVETVATKMIKGIYQHAEKVAKSEIKKFLIDSVEMQNEEVYASSEYISLRFVVNATYYKHTAESGVINGQKFTEDVEKAIAKIQTELNTLSNYFEKPDYAASFEFNDSSKGGEGATWAWRLDRDGNHRDLKIYSLVQNATLNFSVDFKFDYSSSIPSWPWSTKPRKSETITASMNPRITMDIDEDHPDPIYTVSGLRNMAEDKHYRLMNNLVLQNWEPMEFKSLSFDGNGFVIYVESFNVNMTDANKDVKIGLFSSISQNSLVKNVIVAYNNLTFDVTAARSVYFGGFAAQNLGTIYNCEVLAMDIDSYINSTAENPYEDFTSSLFADESKANASSTSAYISQITVNVPASLAANTTVAGFVAQNEGSISNSRVGRTTDSFKYNANTTSVKEPAIVGHFENAFKEFIQNGNGFKIVSTGSVAGFVGINNSISGETSRTITSSYVACLAIENMFSDTSSARTAGFVIENTGVINGCFVYGQKAIGDAICLTGSTIYSATHVGGFAYANSGSIEDSLSNIRIITNAISAGFCYRNNQGATIEQCVSLSPMAQSLINSPFIGHTGLESLNQGTTKNCYYYDEGKVISESTEDDSATAIRTSSELSEEDNLSGFAFGADSLGGGEKFEANSLGVWLMKDKNNPPENYPMLVSANEIAVVKFDLKDSSQATYDYMDDAADNSPIVIATANFWNNYLTRLSKEETVTKNGVGTTINVISRSFRLIKNIASLGSNPSTCIYDFAGRLDGNGLSINGVSISYQEESDPVSNIGLFASINQINKENVVVKNLNVGFTKNQSGNHSQAISAIRVSAVGGLAGIINNSKIYKVSLNGNLEVLGGGYVGGLAGIITGNGTVINNVKSSLSARAGSGSLEGLSKDSLTNFVNRIKEIILTDATRNETKTVNEVETTTTITVPVVKDLKTLEDSYGKYLGFAGSVAGLVDICRNDEVQKNPNVVNVSASGVSRVVAVYAGGLFGYLGNFTFAHDLSFVAKTAETSKLSEQYLIGYQVVGGIAAVNTGEIRFARVTHDNQNELDTSLFTNSVLNSSVNLFRIGITNKDITNTNFYVGGLVGINYQYQAFGSQTKISGIIKDSFNKVAVVPAYNDRKIDDMFDSKYDDDSVALFAEDYITTAGGLVGMAYGARIETSFVTAQVAAQVSGGIVGQAEDNITLVLVNALNNYVSGLGARTFLGGKAFYPSYFYDTSVTSGDNAYYVLNSNYTVGVIAGIIKNANLEADADSERGIEVANKFSGQDGTIKFFNKISSDVEVVDGFTNLSGDFVPKNLIDSSGNIKQITLQDELYDVEYAFRIFPEVSDADWVMENFNEDKKIPYPNFGIVSNPTVTNEEEFLGIFSKPTQNYSVLPADETTYSITLHEERIALTKDFTGAIRGARRVNEDGSYTYPTIYVVLNADKQQYVSLFQTIRRATIENINFVFLVDGTPTGNNTRFGLIANEAIRSTINNVTIQLSSSSLSVMQDGSEKTIGPQTTISVSPYTYFGGLVSKQTGGIITNSTVKLTLTDSENTSKSNYVGGLVATSEGGSLTGNTFEGNATFESASSSASFGGFGGIVSTMNGGTLVNNTFKTLDDNTTKGNVTFNASSSITHFGGIVSETTNMASSSISGSTVEIGTLMLNSLATKFVGGIVGHASADYDSADSSNNTGASIVNSTVTIRTLTGSRDGTAHNNNDGQIDFFVGGIVGYSNAEINGGEVSITNINDFTNYGFGGVTCYANADINGVVVTINAVKNAKITDFGGIAGATGGSRQTENRLTLDRTIKISNCAVSLTIDSSNSSDYKINNIGGLVGWFSCGDELNSCFANISIKGNYETIGGLVGKSSHAESSEKPKISNCYSSGSIEFAESKYIGGLIGHVQQGGLEMNNCYSVCDIGEENDVSNNTETVQGHGTSSKGLLIGSILYYESKDNKGTLITGNNNFAIRECNMELFAVGSYKKTNDNRGLVSNGETIISSNTEISGITTLFISEFYTEDTGFNSSVGTGVDSNVWENVDESKTALPQIKKFTSTDEENLGLLREVNSANTVVWKTGFAHENGSRINPKVVSEANITYGVNYILTDEDITKLTFNENDAKTSGYEAWFASRVESESLKILGSVGAYGVISGINATVSTAYNLSFAGIMTNCKFGGLKQETTNHNPILTIPNSYRGNVYIEKLTINNNANNVVSGYLIGDLNNYNNPANTTLNLDAKVKIKNVEATGTAKTGMIGNIRGNGGSSIVLDDVRAEVSIDNSGVTDTDTRGAFGTLIRGANLKLAVMNSYNKGNIKFTTRQLNGGGEFGILVGGLIGRISDATITNCYNAGNFEYIVSGQIGGSTASYGSTYVGGFVASISNATTTIENCFNIGNLSCNVLSNVQINRSFVVGGFVGYVGDFDDSSSGTIKNCFNAGYVDCSVQSDSVTTPCFGGFVGALWSGGTISNCYSASMRSDLENGTNLNGIAGAKSGSVALSNVYYAQDLLFNDTNQYGTGCDYAELKQIYTSEKISGSKWAPASEISALPFLKICEFANVGTNGKTFQDVTSDLKIVGTLFAPNLVETLEGMDRQMVLIGYMNTGFTILPITGMAASTYANQVNYLTTDLDVNSAISLSYFTGILLGGNNTVKTTNTALFSDIGANAKIIGLNINATLTEDYSNHKTGSTTGNIFGAVINTATNRLYLNNIQAKINGTANDIENVGGLVGIVKSNLNLINIKFSEVHNYGNNYKLQDADKIVINGYCLDSTIYNGDSRIGNIAGDINYAGMISYYDGTYEIIKNGKIYSSSNPNQEIGTAKVDVSNSKIINVTYTAGSKSGTTEKIRTDWDNVVISSDDTQIGRFGGGIKAATITYTSAYNSGSITRTNGTIEKVIDGKVYNLSGNKIGEIKYSGNSGMKIYYDVAPSSGLTLQGAHPITIAENITLQQGHTYYLTPVTARSEANYIALTLHNDNDGKDKLIVSGSGSYTPATDETVSVRLYTYGMFTYSADVIYPILIDGTDLTISSIDDITEVVSKITIYGSSSGGMLLLNNNDTSSNHGTCVGGLVSYNEGIVNINKCYSNLSTYNTIASSKALVLGGILGGSKSESTTSIANSYFAGLVNVDGESSRTIGGIVGLNSGTLTMSNCYDAGVVYVNQVRYSNSLRLLVGSNRSITRSTNCVNYANIWTTTGTSTFDGWDKVTTIWDKDEQDNEIPFVRNDETHTWVRWDPTYSGFQTTLPTLTWQYEYGADNLVYKTNGTNISSYSMLSFPDTDKLIYKQIGVIRTATGIISSSTNLTKDYDGNGFYFVTTGGAQGVFLEVKDSKIITISNLGVDATIQVLSENYGGIANSASANLTFSNCWSAGTINAGTINAGTTKEVGGFVGKTENNLTFSGININNLSIGGNTSDNTTTYATNAGGFVGRLNNIAYELTISGTMINNGSVTASNIAGGIAGQVQGEVSISKANIINNGVITGGDNTGGVIGGIGKNLTIANSIITNNGSVNAGTSGNTGDAAGVVGYVGGNVIIYGDDTNITNFATISSDEVAGGIFSQIEGSLVIGKSSATAIENATNPTITNDGNISMQSVNYVYSGGIVGYITESTKHSVSIFGGTLKNNKTIQSRAETVTQVDSNTQGYAGGIIGLSNQSITIENAKITNTDSGAIIATANTELGRDYINADAYAGGIIGYAGKSVTFSDTELFNVGIVRAEAAAYETLPSAHAGGVIGEAIDTVTIKNATIINSGNKITVISNNNTGYGGGVAGNIDLTLNIENSTITNNGWITYPYYAGGIVGKVDGDVTITDSTLTNNGEIASSEYAGGIVGDINGTLNISGKTTITNNKEISLTGYVVVVGGLFASVGSVTIEITNNTNETHYGLYNNKDLSNQGDPIGGIFGGRMGNITIKSGYIYNKGNISNSGNSDSYLGGIVGEVGSFGSTSKNLTINGGTIINEGTIKANNKGGGIAGVVNGDLTVSGNNTQVNNSGNISASTFAGFAGGVAGQVVGSVSISGNPTISNTGNISALYAGGIVGLVGTGDGNNPESGKVLTISGGTIKNGKTAQVSNNQVTIDGETYNVSDGKITISGTKYPVVNEYVADLTTISSTSGSAGGLFGDIRTRNTTISGGTLTNYAKATGSYSTGGIIGGVYNGTLTITNTNSPKIENYGTVKSTTLSAGGIVGHVEQNVSINGTLTNHGPVTASGGNANKVVGAGGIIGYIPVSAGGTITVTISGGQLTNESTGTISGSHGSGGIFGYIGNGNLQNSNSGQVTLEISGGTITNKATVDDSVYEAGGIIGFVGTNPKGSYTGVVTISGGEISNEGNVGTITGPSQSHAERGGIIAQIYGDLTIGETNQVIELTNQVIISNKGNVKAITNNSCAGGIVGYVDGEVTVGKGAIITNEGYVESTNWRAAGIFGGILGKDNRNYGLYNYGEVKTLKRTSGSKIIAFARNGKIYNGQEFGQWYKLEEIVKIIWQ